MCAGAARGTRVPCPAGAALRRRTPCPSTTCPWCPSSPRRASCSACRPSESQETRCGSRYWGPGAGGTSACSAPIARPGNCCWPVLSRVRPRWTQSWRWLNWTGENCWGATSPKSPSSSRHMSSRVQPETLIHYIAKSIGTPSNERFDYFSNFHEYKS